MAPAGAQQRIEASAATARTTLARECSTPVAFPQFPGATEAWACRLEVILLKEQRLEFAQHVGHGGFVERSDDVSIPRDAVDRTDVLHEHGSANVLKRCRYLERTTFAPFGQRADNDQA